MPRRFRRYVSWRWWALGILCLVIVGRAALWGRQTSQPAPFAGPCEILEVLDGATLLVRPAGQNTAEPVRLRLLGIGVPPSHDQSAVEFTREQVRTGRTSLVLDKRRIDSQGHALGYLYVDGRLLNADLVRRGPAKVTPYPGDNATISQELFRAQDLAHAERLGAWSTGGKPIRALVEGIQRTEEVNE